MSADWIKMRAALCTNPRVLKIANILADSTEVGRHLSTGFNGTLSEIVTSNVTRDVTVACLLRVWCAANEHTDDGVMRNCTLGSIDLIAGVPGFGHAMAQAGWAIEDAKAGTVTFPNFLENNVPSRSYTRSTNAERQAKYRARKRQNDAESNAESNGNSNGNSNVTRDVTSNAREDKNKRRSNSVPKGTDGASPSPPAAVDVIFAHGVPILTVAGVTERNARSMLGLMRKQHGDDAVVAAIHACAVERPLDPVSWLQAFLKPTKASRSKQTELERHNATIAASWTPPVEEANVAH